MRVAARPLLLAGLFLVTAVATAAEEKKPAESDGSKKAKAMLAAADRLAYRPLANGLKDLSLEFSVVTRQGKLRGLWLTARRRRSSPPGRRRR